MAIGSVNEPAKDDTHRSGGQIRGPRSWRFAPEVVSSYLAIRAPETGSSNPFARSGRRAAARSRDVSPSALGALSCLASSS